MHRGLNILKIKFKLNFKEINIFLWRKKNDNDWKKKEEKICISIYPNFNKEGYVIEDKFEMNRL